MIHEFQDWSSRKQESCPFTEFEGCTIAIEANAYLQRLLSTPPSREPLLAALGGLPFALDTHIKHELDTFHSAQITPVFIFDGLHLGKRHSPFEDRERGAINNGAAWELYAQHQAEKAVDAFGKSGYAQPEDLYALLLKVLKENNVEFQVAPYSAWGQLAYLARQGRDFVDAVAGSFEILLLGVDQMITKIDFDSRTFGFVQRKQLVLELQHVSDEMFVDAAMLAGSAVLPTIPILSRQNSRTGSAKIQRAVDHMKGVGSTGVAVCLNYENDADMKNLDYLDRFKRARLALKHQVVLTADGKVQPFEADQLPNDAHEFLGQQLPEELLFYLSKGAVSPHLLNQLASGQIYEVTPVDGGDSEAYKTLVAEKLTGVRQMALATLASGLHRGYLYREYRLSCWFAADAGLKFKLNEVGSSPGRLLTQWNVPETTLAEKAALKSSPTSIVAAMRALSDLTFASKTITPKSKQEPRLLRSKAEVESNALFRFLHLRGYLDEKHQLTAWGKVLATTCAHLDSAISASSDEAALLAIELLRYDLLTSSNMFPNYSGAPLRGSGKAPSSILVCERSCTDYPTDFDKDNTLLLSRIACLGKLHHQSIGFTGPLSRHLLGYTSIINAVRQSLRDLLEASLMSLLLLGDAERDRPDLGDLGVDLPFLLPYDCALGIAMKHYLDELPSFDDPTSEEAKNAVFEKGSKEWLQYSTAFKEDIQGAFGLWDAVSAGVKQALELNLIEERNRWEGIDEWVKERR